MSTTTHKGETSIKRAAFINMLSRYGAALIQLLYSVLLARILTPEDFGIVAIAQVFVTFFALFQDMGLGSAIIQRQDLGTKDVSGLFGFSIVLSAVLATVFALLGVPISAVYREPRLVGVCFALSSTVLFTTLNTVPNALLLKSRRFVVVGARQVLCSIAASVIGLTSAKAGAGPYAIVFYSISNAFINFTWNYSTSRVIPTFIDMMEPVKKVFGYSAYLFGFNLIMYFSRNTDNLLIGYFFGSSSLGNYSKAYQLMQYPQTYLTGVISGVLHPMLAKSQNDLDYIYDTYIKLSKILSLVAVFVSVFCFSAANEIVDVLYGGQWASSAICLRYLSISVWSQMVCGASGPIFQVLNRTKEQFIRGLCISLFTIGATLLGVMAGSIETVSLCVGIAYSVPFILLLPLLIRDSFGRSPWKFLAEFAPDAIIAGVLGLCLACMSWVARYGTAASLAIKLFVGMIVYVILLVSMRQVKWIAPLLPLKIRDHIPKQIQS